MRLIIQHPLKDISVTQKFGENATPLYAQLGMKGHNGYDYRAIDGTPVLASHDGVIVYSGKDGSNGNLVVIQTNEKYEYEGNDVYFKTVYGHLKEGKTFVRAGEQVKVGQVIAEADNTGASTGSHLHFGLKPVRQGEESWIWYNVVQDNGYNGAIDPTPYLPEYQEFRVDLQYGFSGPEVEKMQAFLLRKGYMPPVATLGFYGDITAKAMLRFQLANMKLSWYERYVLKGSRFGPRTREAFNKLS